MADMLAETLQLCGEMRTLERRMRDLRDELVTQAQSIRDQSDTFARVLVGLDQHGRERYTEMVATQTRTALAQVLAEIHTAGERERAALLQITHRNAAATAPGAETLRPAVPPATAGNAALPTSAPVRDTARLRPPWRVVAALGLLTLAVVITGLLLPA